MKLYNLGKIPWEETQLIYHALAELGQEALSLVSPATPYVCIGFHQDAKKEVDLKFCRENNIPVFRRKVGGGAVYLDGDQLFFQLILQKDNPLIPKRKEAFYQKFLQPIIDVYNHIGIAAEYKPINDVLAGTRKISGTGVGEIGNCVVFVGNLIVDFNYEMMARVLKIPDEKFRDKIHKTLRDNLSTIRRELGEEDARQWDESRLNALLTDQFQQLLGPIQPSDKDKALQTKTDELGRRLMSDDWFFQRGRRIAEHDVNVKIRAGVNVLHKMHKAAGGLIRADYEVIDEKMENIHLSGDFFCFPSEAVGWLEAKMEGQPIQDVPSLLTDFYAKNEIDTPGIEIDDWLRVLGETKPTVY